MKKLYKYIFNKIVSEFIEFTQHRVHSWVINWISMSIFYEGRIWLRLSKFSFYTPPKVWATQKNLVKHSLYNPG